VSVAVIIPNRNMAATLHKSLGSACHQGPDEVVVIDDASTDDSLAVVEYWASRFPCVRLIRHKEKTPCHLEAMRDAYESVSRRHIIALSADDILLPGLVTAIRWHIESPVVFTTYDVVRPDGSHIHAVSQDVSQPCSMTPDSVRERLQSGRNATETGIGSSLRSDVAAWLWRHRWQDMGPHMDSIGYAAAAAIHGATYLPITGAAYTMTESSYGRDSVNTQEKALHWAKRCHAFLARAGVDDETSDALIMKRCGVRVGR
jgi:glycosyltransferase involved in cell wall biosynthesis